jgi:hypothetical protein
VASAISTPTIFAGTATLSDNPSSHWAHARQHPTACRPEDVGLRFSSALPSDLTISLYDPNNIEPSRPSNGRVDLIFSRPRLFEPLTSLTGATVGSRLCEFLRFASKVFTRRLHSQFFH